MSSDIAPWGVGPFMTVDVESTSKYAEEARVVEIYTGFVHQKDDGGYGIRGAVGLINPGVEIPQEAIDVHGITNERVQAEGKPPPEILEIAFQNIEVALSQYGASLVIMNAPYDLTVLDRDAERNGMKSLSERLGGTIRPVLDPLVIDSHCIKYRKRVSEKQGARQLKTLCQAHGISWVDKMAHGAEYDALQAVRVIYRLAQQAAMGGWILRKNGYSPRDVSMFMRLASLEPGQIHDLQIDWYREKSENYRNYLLKEAASQDDEAKANELKEKAAVVRFEWPIVCKSKKETLF